MSELSWPSCVLADGIQLISGRHIQASGCNTDGFGMPYLTGPEDFPYAVPPSRYYEIKYHAIGKIISASCYVIGWFMPYYFAGRLESGNVCEYFIMMRYFNEVGITAHKVHCACHDHEDRQHILRNRFDLVHLISSAFTYNSAGASLK